MVTTTRITDETAEYYLGLKDLSQVEEAVASEAAIGSMPHSVCLVRAKDGVDVEALKEEIRTSVNPRKWICVGVEREDIVMASQGNLILMVINPDIPQQIADKMCIRDSVPPEGAGCRRRKGTRPGEHLPQGQSPRLQDHGLWQVPL